MLKKVLCLIILFNTALFYYTPLSAASKDDSFSSSPYSVMWINSDDSKDRLSNEPILNSDEDIKLIKRGLLKTLPDAIFDHDLQKIKEWSQKSGLTILVLNQDNIPVAMVRFLYPNNNELLIPKNLNRMTLPWEVGQQGQSRCCEDIVQGANYVIDRRLSNDQYRMVWGILEVEITKAFELLNRKQFKHFVFETSEGKLTRMYRQKGMGLTQVGSYEDTRLDGENGGASNGQKSVVFHGWVQDILSIRLRQFGLKSCKSLF